MQRNYECREGCQGEEQLWAVVVCCVSCIRMQALMHHCQRIVFAGASRRWQRQLALRTWQTLTCCAQLRPVPAVAHC